jgi:hydrogenase assembly chaperone HypC/HupF
MCMGFPGQVTAVDPLGATVRTRDRSRRASTLLVPDIEVGEWVFVAAGTIVERLDATEAAEISRLLLEAVALEAAEGEGPTVHGGRASERGA